MAADTVDQLYQKARAAADAAQAAADQAHAYAAQLADAGGAAAHAASGGAIDPFVFRLAIFAMAVFVGYYVVWSVTPALHTPLMSVTNAVSSVIVVGALLSIGVDTQVGGPGAWVARIFGFIALILASVNIVGGFLVTERMLSMYKKKGRCARIVGEGVVTMRGDKGPRCGALKRLGGAIMLALAVAVFAPVPAMARELSAAEHASLAATLDSYRTAMRDGDEERVAATLPPRLIASMAAGTGTEPDAYRRSIQSQLERYRDAGLHLSGEFDLAHARFESLEDGMAYAFVPTHAMASGARVADLHFDTLAVLDGGVWYLIAIDSPTRVGRLKKAYPEFAAVDFGLETQKAKP